MLAVKEVSEDHLVTSNGLLVQHQRHWPGDIVPKRKAFQASQLKPLLLREVLALIFCLNAVKKNILECSQIILAIKKLPPTHLYVIF